MAEESERFPTFAKIPTALGALWRVAESWIKRPTTLADCSAVWAFGLGLTLLITYVVYFGNLSRATPDDSAIVLSVGFMFCGLVVAISRLLKSRLNWRIFLMGWLLAYGAALIGCALNRFPTPSLADYVTSSGLRNLEDNYDEWDDVPLGGYATQPTDAVMEALFLKTSLTAISRMRPFGPDRDGYYERLTNSSPFTPMFVRTANPQIAGALWLRSQANWVKLLEGIRRNLPSYFSDNVDLQKMPFSRRLLIYSQWVGESFAKIAAGLCALLTGAAIARWLLDWIWRFCVWMARRLIGGRAEAGESQELRRVRKPVDAAAFVVLLIALGLDGFRLGFLGTSGLLPGACWPLSTATVLLGLAIFAVRWTGSRFRIWSLALLLLVSWGAATTAAVALRIPLESGEWDRFDFGDDHGFAENQKRRDLRAVEQCEAQLEDHPPLFSVDHGGGFQVTASEEGGMVTLPTYDLACLLWKEVGRKRLDYLGKQVTRHWAEARADEAEYRYWSPSRRFSYYGPRFARTLGLDALTVALIASLAALAARRKRGPAQATP